MKYDGSRDQTRYEILNHQSLKCVSPISSRHTNPLLLVRRFHSIALIFPREFHVNVQVKLARISPRMSQMTKTLRSVKNEWKDQMEHIGEASPDLSSIEKDSIFQDDQFNSDGNPFHSTAMEDDFSPVQTHQEATAARKEAERTETPRRDLGTYRRSSAAKQGKDKQKGSQNTSSTFKTPSVPPLTERVMSKPKAMPLRKISEETSPSVSQGTSETSASVSQGTSETSASVSQGTTVPSTTGGDSSEESDSDSPSGAGDDPSPPIRRQTQPARRRSEGKVGASGTQPKTKSGGQRMSRGSSVAETQKKNRKSSGRVPLQKIPEENELQQGTSTSAAGPDTDSDIVSDENSEYAPPSKKKSRHGQRSQEEEEEDEEDSSMPPKKNARGQKNAIGQKKSRSSSGSRRKQSRKSSSGSSDTGAREKRRKQKVRNPIDLEVVLEAFRDFVEEYKETVDSNAVQKAIDHMSESFVDQLTEAITATKELTTVKKRNMKLNIAINSKRSKLVDAKNELIQSEAKVRALEKERQQLDQRLTDLTKGMSLLTGLTDLHTKYLGYCEAHPKETPSYGPTSLPALLMETRCMLGAEHQLKTVNAKLQQVLDNVDQK